MPSARSHLSLAVTGDYQYPAQYKATQGQANFIDGSGPIFTMYMEMASEEDKKMVEGWKADADGILIFVRHYLSILCIASPPHLQ